MSPIWTHVDGRISQSAAQYGATQATIDDSNQYNKPGSSSFLTRNRSFFPSPTTKSSFTSSLPRRSSSYPTINYTSNTRNTPIVSMNQLTSGDATRAPAKPLRKAGISFTKISKAYRARRAQSEPLPDAVADMEHLTSDSFNTGRRAQSVPLLIKDVEMKDVVEENTQAKDDDTTSRLLSPPPMTINTELTSKEGDATQNRQPSPAPTDVIDADSQEILANLPASVKVRDFAYAPPYRAANSPSTIAYATSATATYPLPVTETFDAILAISEIELRWCQRVRTRPVQGKTLRRLLDMGWITEEEMTERAAPMDFEALKDYDSKPQYPWRPFGHRKMPGPAERQDIMRVYMTYWAQVENTLSKYENKLIEDAKEQRLIDISLKDQERRAAEYAAQWVTATSKGKGKERSPDSPSGRSKRRLDEDGQQEAGGSTEGSSGQGNRAAPKRRRVTPPVLPFELHQIKQFPAGRTTAGLNPRSQQAQSQLLRADTPPLDPEDPSQEQTSPRRGQPLVHPRHQRGLSRQQTFVSLVR